jgi:hypothetical protein
MVRLLDLLLTVSTVASVLMMPTTSSASCTPLQSSRGICSYSSGDSVGLIARSGSVKWGSRDRSAVVVRHNPDSGGGASHCDIVCVYLQTHPDDPSLHLALRGTPDGAVVRIPPRPGTSTPPRPVTSTPAQVVTAQDVAHFLAAAGAVHAEPDGWAVVGVPANYWIDIEPFTVDGTLLDEVAQVRFTPIAYQWDYGDGTGRTTTTGGSSWQALGQAELTATPTSHVFATAGARTIRVTVAFAAEYRLGAGAWAAVVGEVTAIAPPVPVRVVVERTLLTATG